ncbi:3-hydroxybutyryl-CoA dehydrogenase [Desulfotomaculum arcticum]|uniref:3-hydroxybutyryl-CoA dehydrogenase n=1 Tax=Desulfotruncus arcticus DSM 17038 TaxID=1121424 RepID=A0A1I2TKH6_9FIRM|nr:3-hydroxyacyl-CoA dehydrogenase family protein [Desulfotruncus arcticus]SFG63887.1 3-hydroxybutyryl-CoA dehydrogenase [Desulfotomaculum arcticum] [Desulfotruncus arcticus DSM 17038]
MEFKKIAVIGAGVMGAGIAQVCAQKGCSVWLQDISKPALDKALESIIKSLKKGVEKKKLTPAQKEDTLTRIVTTTHLPEAVESVDLIIEAVFENLEVKKDIFRLVDQYALPNAVIASNTSALPITAMGAVTNRPERVLGLHFMNPVPLMKGVEVIPGLDTAKEVLEAGVKFIEDLGKEPVKAVDYAGFIVTRILDAMLNEAVNCVADGNDPGEVDRAMKICTNFPMGPCELIDLAGADIVYHGLNTLKDEFGERFHASPLLKKMVRAGHVGRKSGQGFYDYSK